jgi:cobalt-zinc-cadmium efflux system membrane fusion protein
MEFVDDRCHAERLRRAIAAALLLAGLTVGCAKKPAKEDPAKESPAGPQRVELSRQAVETAGIRTELVAVRPIDEVLSLAGALAFDENKVARVGPRVGGRVARILVDLGQPARRGQVLALIDSPELGGALAEWRKTRSTFEVRKRDSDRAQKLLDGKAISQGEFLSREGEFRVARAEMENADSRMHLFGLSHQDLATLSQGGEVSSQFPLRSPIAGKVVDRQINPGEVVDVGKSLFTIGDTRNLWLFAQVYEKDLAQVRTGQEIEVVTEAYPDERFRGRIDYVGEQVDPATRTVRARAVISNISEKLKPGMFVEARLAVVSGTPVLAISPSSVADVDKTPTVFVAISNTVFEARPIEPGRAGKTAIEVKRGLRAGERVVSEGTLTLKAEMQKSELAED